MKRVLDLLAQREFHALAFCFGLLLFSWPLVSASDLDSVSSAFIYLFGCWALVIIVQFLISLSLSASQPSEMSDHTEP